MPLFCERLVLELPEKEFIDKAGIRDPEEIGNLCAKLKKKAWERFHQFVE